MPASLPYLAWRDKMLIGVTPGDPEGVGPEIVWKALRSPELRRRKNLSIVCIGARAPFDRLGARVFETSLAELLRGKRPPSGGGPRVWLIPAPLRAPGKFLPGFQSGWAIETATRLALQGKISAITTGPIHKERLNRGGYKYPGHTEFLADLCGKKHVTMMLANDQLRVSLATTHVALKNVPKVLTAAVVQRAVLQTADHLRHWWMIRKPRIAVAALNPHAGESGLFGDEEKRVIEPALRSLRRSAKGRFTVTGPLPADTLFAKHVLARPADRHDAVICMYHDQGLIPVKLLDFPQTVNVTLGLPIVRTSVDHGVGFDIAGKGIADPSSLLAAIRMAAEIAAGRKKK